MSELDFKSPAFWRRLAERQRRVAQTCDHVAQALERGAVDEIKVQAFLFLSHASEAAQGIAPTLITDLAGWLMSLTKNAGAQQ